MLSGGCCFFLLSALYLFIPGKARTTPLRHNFVDENQVLSPSSSCSIEELVNWLNFGDLAKLISRWAEKENTKPITVIELLSNSIPTSPQVHRMPNENLEKLLESTQGRHYHSHRNHRPAAVFPLLIDRETPYEAQPIGQLIDVLPPPPPHLLSPPAFDMAAIRSPPNIVINNPPAEQTSFIPLLPMGGSRPPPDATVRVADGVFSTPLSSVPVTVTPRMSVTEALQQASTKFRDEDSVEYEISWSKNNHRKCLAIRSVGKLEATTQFHWEIQVVNSFKKEIWRAMCLPPLSEVQVLPGTIITLNYVAQAEESSD